MTARLEILAKPGARFPSIERRDGIVCVGVRERAVDGEANDAVVRALAKWLDVAPSRVSLLHGARGRRKLVAVEGVEEATLAARIDALPQA
jgi:uncharacterized protein YggU (UPF0235/DUF167 family)